MNSVFTLSEGPLTDVQHKDTSTSKRSESSQPTYLEVTVDEINASETSSVLLGEERKVFEQSFLESYSKNPACTERIGNLEQLMNFLSGAFDGEVEAFEKCSSHHDNQTRTCKFFHAKADNKIVGYLSIDLEHDNKRTSIYYRQLAVLPKYQRYGIARSLIAYPLRTYSYKVARVSCRSWNKPAIRFYNSMGFTLDKECHPGLDSEEYVGFMWTEK